MKVVKGRKRLQCWSLRIVAILDESSFQPVEKVTTCVVAGYCAYIGHVQPSEHVCEHT